jgi:hypothetical protein
MGISAMGRALWLRCHHPSIVSSEKNAYYYTEIQNLSIKDF